MANELTNYSGYYTSGAALAYRQFVERQTRDTGAAMQRAADQQTQVIRKQTQAERENAMAIVASNAVIARVNEQGFAQQHSDALMVNNTLEAGFSGLANQLGTMTASFNAGFDRVTGSIERMSADICGRLDAINDTLKNPLRTQARELYNRAATRHTRGLFEEALKDIKAAVEKDETDYLSWFLMGNVYLFGAGEFSNVIDLDQAITALTNAAKYISPDIMTQDARTKKISLEPRTKKIALEPQSAEAVDLIREIRSITGYSLSEAKAVLEALGGDIEATSRRLATLQVSDRLAAEIYFYLGLAQYYKSNDLTLGKQEAEAKSVLESALQTFNRSLEYSDGMLESRYNSARCRVLLGDTEGAIKDLEADIKGDRNYALKVLADSDFDGIHKEVVALIERMRKESYLRTKPVFDTLKARLDDTLFLDGELPDKVKKTAEEWVPQTFGEALPYFDIRDGEERFPVILGWLDKGDPGIQSKSRIAEEDARRKAEVEEWRRAEEEQSARDAKERARYKRQWNVWLVLRIMFAIAFAGIGTHIFIPYYTSYIENSISDIIDLSAMQFFILLAILGCTLSGIFGIGGCIAGLVAAVVIGVVCVVSGVSVFYAIIATVVSAIGLGIIGLGAGFIVAFFYQILKTMLKAELKLEPRDAPSAGVIPAPEAGTILRYAVAQGSQAASGDTIMIIKSTGGELEIKSATAGKVHFLVTEKTQVAAQQPVAEVL